MNPLSMVHRWCLPLLVLLIMRPGPALADGAATRVWRVCVSDQVAPPFLFNDASHPGLVERIATKAGRQMGWTTIILRYPSARCRTMMAAGTLDAEIASPTTSNLELFQFPMKNGAVDLSRGIAQVTLVWVKRQESAYEWTGSTMLGGKPEDTVVGTRMMFKVAFDPLTKLGFKVDATALTARQALLKLERKRVDMVLALQEEVEASLQEPQLSQLVVLPKPFSSPMYFLAVNHKLPPDLQAEVEAWWTAIGHLRQLPEYRVD